MTPLRPFAILLACLLLTACSLINRNVEPPAILGHDAMLQGQGRLVCSTQCAEHGQCGEIRSLGKVVLAGRFEPVTVGHDVYFPADMQVPILAAQTFQAQLLSQEEPFLVNFYAIAMPDGESGWVAGWCLAQAEGAQTQ